MKKLFLVANWKSNNTQDQIYHWFAGVKDFLQATSIKELKLENKEVIICPSFTLLSYVKSSIINDKLPVKIGAQNISPFDEGSYTGEVNGRQIGEFAEFVIIGHSERRKNFGENDEMVSQKIAMAINSGLIPIVCISEISQTLNIKYQIQKLKPKNVIVAYEPLFAIGSGNPDTPENANKTANGIKKQLGDIYVLYGGSVTSKNISGFTKMPDIDGVLVGKASLNPFDFLDIIKNA